MFFISYIEFSRVQQEFARGLSQFRFQTIGTEKTDDEVLIGIYIHYSQYYTDMY